MATDVGVGDGVGGLEGLNAGELLGKLGAMLDGVVEGRIEEGVEDGMSLDVTVGFTTVTVGPGVGEIAGAGVPGDCWDGGVSAAVGDCVPGIC